MLWQEQSAWIHSHYPVCHREARCAPWRSSWIASSRRQAALLAMTFGNVNGNCVSTPTLQCALKVKPGRLHKAAAW
jgi:hypothetical protein